MLCIETQLEQAASQCFPKTPGAKKHEYFSDETFHVVRIKGKIMAQDRLLGREAKVMVVRCCFVAWRFGEVSGVGSVGGP
eukprot:12422567-Karenia_brevis.AAC.1